MKEIQHSGTDEMSYVMLLPTENSICIKLNFILDVHSQLVFYVIWKRYIDQTVAVPTIAILAWKETDCPLSLQVTVSQKQTCWNVKGSLLILHGI